MPPYRSPWEPARRVLHPGEFATPGELLRTLYGLRERVEAGHFDDASREDLARFNRELSEARDRLRQFARPTRAVLVSVAATFTGASLLLVFLKFASLAWLALGVAIVTGLVAAAASEWAQRWLDAVPEYEDLVADFRKLMGSPRARPRFIVDGGGGSTDLGTVRIIDSGQAAEGTVVDIGEEHPLAGAAGNVRVVRSAYGGDTLPIDLPKTPPLPSTKKRGER
jgi:hypothetical protein